MFYYTFISSRGCEDLMPPDLILLSIQCIAAQEYWSELREIEESTYCENTHLPCEFLVKSLYYNNYYFMKS